MNKLTLNPALSPLEAAGKLTEFWSPQVIAEMDDHYVKVARLEGTLTWHSHEGEDELFLILKGHLTIEYEDGLVQLGPGDLHVVPKGVRHNPVADEECLVMLIEKKSTLHTGDVMTGKNRGVDEQLKGYSDESN